jgi:hypothetical protein
MSISDANANNLLENIDGIMSCNITSKEFTLALKIDIIEVIDGVWLFF